ncbi:HD domain-containing protein [Mycolicibacter sinensis]|uniref:HD domain-containing protein n=1 Tax=Mycolicibacter sinensis (strain JDM601) TaxID=875328 RepID=UPI0007EC25AC|nr:HD domain-containing protein [Mycolicibacter sinensis]OBH16635.1 metal-dependent phosphohydrolase [Mycolicibacter sinensis]
MDGAVVQRARRIAESRLAPLATRLAHVRGVAAAAEGLVTRVDPLEADALVAAAWLHDVGYAPSVRSTGFHPVDGAAFVRAEGFPAVVVSLVAYHTGAVFEARERGLSEALAEFVQPPGLLLDVLTCADMQTGPDGSPIRPEDRVSEILSRYGEDDPVHRAITLSAPSLLAAVARVDALVG